MQLRLFVKRCMLWSTSCVLASASHLAYSYALRIFWNPSSQFVIYIFFNWLYTLEQTMLPLPFLSSGMNEPSMQMFCVGLYFGVG